MPRHILPHIWWVALLFGLLGACALTLGRPEPLRVRVATWPGYAPLYAVAAHDLAAPTRVEVSTSELAQDNYRAFAEHRVDVLATTLHSAIQFHDQNVDTIIILITDYSNGADGIIARPGIDEVADLEGQRVGVESGSVSHFVLLRALGQANLSEDDVQIINIGVSEAIDAIDQGRVDAAVVWEPVLSRYTESRNREPIYTSDSIPNEVIDVLVVHPETLEQRPDDLVNLAQGWDTAIARWRVGSSEVAGTMASTLGVDEGELYQQLNTIHLIDLERNLQLLELEGPESIRPAFNNIVSFLQDHDQLQDAPPQPAEMMSAQVVQNALREAEMPAE
jgi:NitT/TauT family transport system substrate-binding protein